MGPHKDTRWSEGLLVAFRPKTRWPRVAADSSYTGWACVMPVWWRVCVMGEPRGGREAVDPPQGGCGTFCMTFGRPWWALREFVHSGLGCWYAGSAVGIGQGVTLLD